MELDYRLEADNQRAFAKAYEGHPRFVVPHIVASAPKVVIQEWIEGIPMSVIIREGTQEQRDLMGTRLFELTYDAPRRLEMMHGDAHPGNFMLLPDGKMGVIDFGAVAPMPGGIPIEIGMATRFALDDDYDNLLTAMQAIGFVQKGEQVSKREMDEMMKQYVEPLEVEVFHYTRKWLQRDHRHEHEARSCRGPDQGRAADGHPGQASDPDAGDRVQRRDLLPSSARPAEQLATELIAGFADEAGLRAVATRETRQRLRCCRARLGVLRGRHADACAQSPCPVENFAPNAPRLPSLQRGVQRTRDGSGNPRTALSRVRARRGSRRTTYRGHSSDTAPPASSSLGMSQ